MIRPTRLTRPLLVLFLAALLVCAGGARLSAQTVYPYTSATQTGRCFIASPSDGTAGLLACRTVTAADVPTLNQPTTANAATASASDHSISSCGASNWATGMSTAWALTCAQPAFSDITGSIAESTVTNLTTDLAAKSPLASPTFTGTPAAPTAAVDTNTTQLATTAFVLAQAASATPIIDGTGTVGTSTRFARGDHIHPTNTSRAPLASPTLTGTPAAPTAAVDTNTTQLATTAFVLAQSASANPVMDGSVAVGTSTRYARADHVHASDTSRAPLVSPSFTTPALGVATGTSVAVTGLVSSSGTAGIGYATGAGGTVTQATSRTTGVTLSKICGQITTNTTSLAALAAATFTVTNTLVAATDVILVSQKSGATNVKTDVRVTAVAAGSFNITVHNIDAVTAEVGAIVINFVVIKGVSS